VQIRLKGRRLATAGRCPPTVGKNTNGKLPQRPLRTLVGGCSWEARAALREHACPAAARLTQAPVRQTSPSPSRQLPYSQPCSITSW